jgi:hypothetical protein
LPALNSLPILFSAPPGAAGNHVVAMLNGVDEFVGRHVDTYFETKNIEHNIQYHDQPFDHYQNRVNYLIDSGVRAIATHWNILPDKQVNAVQATWSDPTLAQVFACRDLLTVKSSSLIDHISQDTRCQLLFKSPMSNRKKWIIFALDVVKHGESTGRNQKSQHWHDFSLNNIFNEKFIDDLILLCKTINFAIDVDFARKMHKKWLERNPPDDFTIRRAVRRLEQLTL